MDQNEYDYVFKILIIGDSGTGKSSILLRFTDNQYDESYISTIGVDFRIRTMEFEVGGVSKIVKFQIWDTAGQERFRSIVASYYRGCVGIFICYDITDPESFAHVPNWITDAEKYGSVSKQLFLIGNKCDLEHMRKVSRTTAQDFADQNNMLYIETSAKKNINVDDAFKILGDRIIGTLIIENKQIKDRTNTNGIQIGKPTPKKSCC
jgi:Ras-related protein Rab-1A